MTLAVKVALTKLDMKENEDDEIVYLDEKSPVAISFEELQKRVIENIGSLRVILHSFNTPLSFK